MPYPARILKTLAPAAATAAAVAATVLGLAGCGDSSSATTLTTSSGTTTDALPGTNKPTVIIGDKNFTEQFLLGQLYAQALTAQGYSVQLNPNIGPTEVTLQALYSGRLAMYPEYLGTWDSTIAGVKRGFRTARGAYAAGRRYARAHGLELLMPTPFSDTQAIAVTRTYTALHRLRTIGDLRKVSPYLTIGGAPQFQQNPSGLSAVEAAYSLIPARYTSLAIGSQYTSLDQGRVQAAVVSTTDGQLDAGGYALLRDPLRAFGFGQVIPVVPAKVIAAEGPAFARTIDRVSALLTTPAIRALNASVDVHQQDPATVAKQFLQAQGLVPLDSS